MAVHPVKDFPAAALFNDRADLFVLVNGAADPVFTIHRHTRHRLKRMGVLFKCLVEPRVVHVNDQQTVELIIELIEIAQYKASRLTLTLHNKIFAKERKQLHRFRFVFSDQRPLLRGRRGDQPDDERVQYHI